jgi:hypothetical protein
MWVLRLGRAKQAAALNINKLVSGTGQNSEYFSSQIARTEQRFGKISAISEDVFL